MKESFAQHEEIQFKRERDRAGALTEKGKVSKQKNIIFTEVKFYEEAADDKLRFAVIISRFQGKWVFCKHKERNTLEVPGGHREPGEAIFYTAERELQEETGAIDFKLQPICAYSVTERAIPGGTDGEESFGMLYFAEIKTFEKELHSEIERIYIMEHLPENWTYPFIQPELMKKAEELGYL